MAARRTTPESGFAHSSKLFGARTVLHIKNLCVGNGFQKRGDSRIEIPTAPTHNPKSETMASTPHDAELLKDLRGLGKPQLFDENDTDISLFFTSEDNSIFLRHMDDVVDTSPDKCHRHIAIRGMDNYVNQHIEIPQIQHIETVVDDCIVIQRNFAENHRDQGT